MSGNECGVSDEAQLAAYSYTEEVFKAPDGNDGPYPWVHGHAVRKAFCAGAAWGHQHPDTTKGGDA